MELASCKFQPSERAATCLLLWNARRLLATKQLPVFPAKCAHWCLPSHNRHLHGGSGLLADPFSASVKAIEWRDIRPTLVLTQDLNGCVGRRETIQIKLSQTLVASRHVSHHTCGLRQRRQYGQGNNHGRHPAQRFIKENRHQPRKHAVPAKSNVMRFSTRPGMRYPVLACRWL
jgi:hypothetical protein